MVRSKTKEDYLRIIYEFHGEEGVRSIDVAKTLKVSKASVSEMIRKLSDEKFVKMSKYGKIFLTRKGMKHAEEFFDRHLSIKNFIKLVFDYDDEKAGEEAHKLEHSFSSEILDKLENLGRIIKRNLGGGEIEELEKPAELEIVGQEDFSEEKIPSYVG